MLVKDTPEIYSINEKNSTGLELTQLSISCLDISYLVNNINRKKSVRSLAESPRGWMCGGRVATGPRAHSHPPGNLRHHSLALEVLQSILLWTTHNLGIIEYWETWHNIEERTSILVHPTICLLTVYLTQGIAPFTCPGWEASSEIIERHNITILI